jgi:hypothetical protein
MPRLNFWATTTSGRPSRVMSVIASVLRAGYDWSAGNEAP